MPEPITTSTATTALSGFAFLSYFAGLSPEVVLGAFSGAVIFVTSATEFPVRRRLLLSCVSFIAGVIMCRPVSIILIGLARNLGIDPLAFERGSVDAAGALVSAIVSVKIGIRMYGKAASAEPEAHKQGGDHDQS